MDKQRENQDGLLVSECLAGSEKAWNEFYSRFVGLMKNVVKRYGNLSPADIDDVIQSAFTALTTALQSYDPKQPLHTFVCLITERVLIDEYRKTKAAKRDALTESIDHHDGGQEDGGRMIPSDLALQDEEMEKAELSLSLRVALRDLDPRCRELIRLRYFKELSFNEMVEILGGTENTLTVQTRRCLDKLKTRFQVPKSPRAERPGHNKA